MSNSPMSNSPIKTAADAPKTDKPNVAPSTQPELIRPRPSLLIRRSLPMSSLPARM